jgi:hypothetical protein
MVDVPVVLLPVLEEERHCLVEERWRAWWERQTDIQTDIQIVCVVEADGRVARRTVFIGLLHSDW